MTNQDPETRDNPDPRPDGRAYWRSLEERAGAAESADERFPTLAADLMRRAGTVDRRRFLELMAASIGLAGLTGCRRPEERILPYADLPESVTPGSPTYYASALPRRGSAVAILVESHEGRPTKIEGNPRAPDADGATDATAQAAVLDLYDPDRSRSVLRRDGAATAETTWEAFDAFAAGRLAAHRASRGRGLRFLSGDVASPALDLLRAHVRETLPEARWHVYEPIGSANLRDGAALAFGSDFAPRYHLDRARVVLTLDADILGVEEDGVRHVHGFSLARRAEKAGDPMNRLYAVEPHYTVTGGMADHRLRLPASQVLDYAMALAAALLPADDAAAAALRGAAAGRTPPIGVDPRWIAEVAADLRANAGKSLIVAGRRQPPLVHALAHALNASLGNVGETVALCAPAGEPAGDIVELAEAMRAGRVETLAILGGNPAHDAPADLDFAALLANVPHSIRLGSHVDETSSRCAWSLPEAHLLESWGDVRTVDGLLLPIQPLIEPLFGGRTALEIVARLSGFEPTSPYEIARRSFRKIAGEADFEANWRRFLHDGLHDGALREPEAPAPKWDAIAAAAATAPPPAPAPSKEALELVFAADSKVDDGRHANNGWLQEVPDPITKIAWDNAAVMGPATARALGLKTGDVARLELRGRAVEIAVAVVPGSADFSVAVAPGYGRPEVGRVGRGVGVDVYPLRAAAAPDIAAGLKVSRTGRTHVLASTQEHFRMEGRDLIREIDAAAPAPDHAAEGHGDGDHPDIQERPPFDGEHQWGMAIDLNLCVGCNACAVACQAENNIPIVGKDEVARGRVMHWIRLDRYFSGDEDDPGMARQPVACVHCENAPCEVVCPVNATVHSNEGVNLQVYNRCIGTRYCSNNCPYKVRRFNFFDYNQRPLDKLRLGPLAPKGMAETLRMRMNPDVTVRMRGVMEKCTYCVQRIERARIGARTAAGDSPETRVPDGTIAPACAQACPARAIVFGDVSDPDSRVSRIKRQARDYALLGELNTKPRTTYQARIRNPNPRMPAAGGGDERRKA